MTIQSWSPLIVSIIVSLTIGVTGLTILAVGSRLPRKTHLMNVFSQLFFALFSTAMLTRSFYWVAWIN